MTAVITVETVESVHVVSLSANKQRAELVVVTAPYKTTPRQSFTRHTERRGSNLFSYTPRIVHENGPTELLLGEIEWYQLSPGKLLSVGPSRPRPRR
jgi:hypothetical protein